PETARAAVSNRPPRTLGWCRSMWGRLVLEDLLRAHRDRLAPPALLARRIHVGARDARVRAVLVVAQREHPVSARGEVGVVASPRPRRGIKAPVLGLYGDADPGIPSA